MASRQIKYVTSTPASLTLDPPPVYQSFFPAISSETGTLTTTAGLTRYQKVGTLIVLNGYVTIINAGTAGGYLAVSIPFPPSPSPPAVNGCGNMFNNDGSVHGVTLSVYNVPFGLAITKYDGTSPIAAPMQYAYSITYETAS